jgi:hypothetical protein
MKKLLLTGVACTLVIFFLSFVIHGVLLEPYYTPLAERGVFRMPIDANGYMHFMIIAQVIFGFAFAWIYTQGIDKGRPWHLQGLRFGLAAACLAIVPRFLIYYVVQPLPGMLVVQQIVFDSIAIVITGLVAAFINKDRLTPQD